LCRSFSFVLDSIRTEMTATQSNSGQDEAPVKNTSNRSVIRKKGIPIDSVDVQKRAKKWKINRRFSNGASSQGTEDDNSSIKKIDIASAKPTSTSSLRKSLNRQISEGSCLDELRETLEKDGDLAKTVVRIEVSVVSMNDHRRFLKALNYYLPFVFCITLYNRLHLIHPSKKSMMVYWMGRY
jgi:histone deacetylase complex regulatory component SIN3